jgi:hypothetical protein
MKEVMPIVTDEHYTLLHSPPFAAVGGLAEPT